MDKPVRTDSHTAGRSNRDLVFSLATCGSLFVLGTWSLTAAGCGAGMKTNEQRMAQRRNMNPSGTTMTELSAKKDGKLTKAEQAATTLVASDVALESSANSTDDCLETTIDGSELEARRERLAWQPVQSANRLNTKSGKKMQLEVSTSALASSAEDHQKNKLPNGKTVALSSSPATAMSPTTSGWIGATQFLANRTWQSGWNTQRFVTPSNTGASMGNYTVAGNTNNAGNNFNASNDPNNLSKLLANAFANSSTGSLDPMRVWFIYSSLAVSNPDITLPEGWGEDLLPTERERVMAAYAGFSALGRSLRDGANKVDPATRQALVAALVGEPSLSIPKVDLCTKVVGYGNYSPVPRRSFLAGSDNRVIVYSELDGFKSQLENGKWTTRLATRVSIVGNGSGGTNIAWSRSPEWTEVVDTSDAPRSEFFLGEIIPISRTLAAGNYKVRVEVKDLSTGSTTSTLLPIQVLTERAFAAVSD